MAIVQGDTGISGNDLLRAVERLDPPEFAHFVAGVLRLRARADAPRLSAAEAALLARINRDLPDEGRRCSEELIAKRRAGALTPDEHSELLGLTKEVEARQADRLAALAHRLGDL